ncbi:MAG: hypothetical protein Q4D41_05260 [Prevotellaceae bacterium]|nr:hypothetical protein [Prevotellaceae bacterium]
MAVKRLQNKIAESRFSLPIVSVYALMVWLAIGLVEQQLYVQLAIFALSAYLMVELNNSNSLLSMYSRMVSCSYIMLTAMSTFILYEIEPLAVQLCLIGTYLILFRCYQDKRAQGLIFYAFFCIGIASTMFIQILFFVPFIWIMMAVNLMAFSHRILWASIIGLITPYWFLAGYYAFTSNLNAFVEHFLSIAEFEPLFVYNEINIYRIITFSFLVLMSLIGIIHFLRKGKDKIRTRMIYEIFIAMDVITFVFIVLQPQHADTLIGIMAVNTSVLIARYIAQTHTWLTNISFILIMLITFALTIFNIWMPLTTFL